MIVTRDLSEFVQKNHGDVIHMLRSLYCPERDIKDVAQIFYIRCNQYGVLKGWDPDRAKFSTYIYHVLRNVLYHQHQFKSTDKRQGVEIELKDEDYAAPESIWPRIRELRDWIDRSFEGLARDQLQAILKAKVLGDRLTHYEAASGGNGRWARALRAFKSS